MLDYKQLSAQSGGDADRVNSKPVKMSPKQANREQARAELRRVITECMTSRSMDTLELAQRIKVPRKRLQQWLNGTRKLPFKRATDMLAAMDASLALGWQAHARTAVGQKPAD